MSKFDEIDRRRAAAYAWRFVAPGTEVSEFEDPEDILARPKGDPDMDPVNVKPPGALKAQRQTCETLADGVDRVWQLADPDAQAEGVTTLVERASDLGMALTGMHHRRIQNVRLLRLVARHFDRLSTDAREHAYSAATWLEITHPEVIDLLAEVARTGDLTLAGSVHMLLTVSGCRLERYPDAGARFAAVLEHSRTACERHIALMWLSRVPTSEAVGPLRRVLRQPCFSLRARALSLLTETFPDAVQADDLMFLLEDAVARVPPILYSEENRRAGHALPEKLTQAIIRNPPPGGHEPLLRIVEGDCAPRRFECVLDETWALCTLAAAYPEHAVPHIDAQFRRVEAYRRIRAAKAACCLPDELAWPRLAAAAADPIPDVAEMVQETWLKRRGSLYPLDEFAGVATELLDKPPGDLMRSRLAMLRRGSKEVRAAMAEVLLKEAPDPEALVLLLFLAADDSLWYQKARPGLPASRKDLCTVIIQGFAGRGVRGLCLLAARYPDGPWGWLDSMSDLLTGDFEFPEDGVPLLRDMAVEEVADMSREIGHGVLEILIRTGVPAALFARLWSMAMEPVERRYHWRPAADALAAIRDMEPEQEQIIIAEVEDALAAADPPRLARAAVVALRCGLDRAVPMIRAWVQENVTKPQDDLAVTSALGTCVYALGAQAGLSDEWYAAALARPGTQAFAVAARRLRLGEAEPEALAALRAALHGTSVTAAAEAAVVLLQQRMLEVGDPIVTDLMARAPMALGARIAGVMSYQEVPMRGLWPLIEPMFTSPDPNVTGPLSYCLFRLATEGMVDELMALGPKIVEPQFAETYREWRQTHREDGEYWQEDLEIARAERQAATWHGELSEVEDAWM